METKKERFIKILKRVLIGLSIGLNVFFLIAMIIGGASVKKTNKLNKVDNVSEKVEFKQVNKKLVSYYDEDYQVEFDVDEIDNYSFENLFNLIFNNSLYEDIRFEFGISVYSFDSYDQECEFIKYDDSGDFFVFYSTKELLKDYYDVDVPLNYSFFSPSDGVPPYENALLINFSASNYQNAKQAIELDIQANENTMTDGIFETLTESTVSFIGTLGSGIVAMTSVFYDSANSQLTTIGLLSVIVVAVSLSYFLFRLIIGLIRMRG